MSATVMVAALAAWLSTPQATASALWLIGVGLFANLAYVAARDIVGTTRSLLRSLRARRRVVAS